MDEIRKDFPIFNRKVNDKPLVYLDSAATSQKPKQVIDAITDFYTNYNANVHRGFHTLAQEADQKWLEAHQKVANFINADSHEEVIFTRNATEGLNFVVNTYGRQKLQTGDVVVITEMEHHSNIIPWQLLAQEKGIKLEWIPVGNDFELDLEYLEYLIRKYRERVKIVSMVHQSNVLGTVNDISRVVELMRTVGGVVVLDAAQSIEHMKIDVKELDCDFMVFSGHKMYGPTGIGVVYGRKAILDELEPWMGGGDMIKKVWKTGAEWNELPWKFEAGTPNIAGGIGLGAAVDWIEKNIDWEEYVEHESHLTTVAMVGLKSISKVKIFGTLSADDRRGVIAFTVAGMHPHDVVSLLDEYGIAVRAGYLCAEPLHKRFELGPTVRLSLAAYNTVDEVRYFIESLKSVAERFN